MDALPTNDILSRIVVVGTSGCGKSTLARKLSEAREISHIELDSLYWGPNWTPIPAERFQEQVARATAQPSWICDGNYASVRAIVWRRATTIVWLNFSLRVVFGRALRRSVWRAWSDERLFADNRESFRLTFLSGESILLWALRTHGQYRREYRQIHSEPQFSHLNWIEFNRPDDADQWLGSVSKARSTHLVSSSYIAEKLPNLVD